MELQDEWDRAPALKAGKRHRFCGSHAGNSGGAQNGGAAPQGEDEKAPHSSCGLTRAREMSMFGRSQEGRSGEQISRCACVA